MLTRGLNKTHLIKKAAFVGTPETYEKDACRVCLTNGLAKNVHFLGFKTYSQLIWAIMKMANVDLLQKSNVKKMPNRNAADLDKLLMLIIKDMDHDNQLEMKGLVGTRIINNDAIKSNIKKINTAVASLISNTT
jgi:hypothetical protein